MVNVTSHAVVVYAIELEPVPIPNLNMVVRDVKDHQKALRVATLNVVKV